MLIANATILTPTERMANGAVRLQTGHIGAVASTTELPPAPGEEVFDAQALLLAPAFLDLQINGAFGHDFTQDPGSIWQVAARLPQYGVASFLPTIITSPLDVIHAAQRAVQEAPAGFRGATPLGLHLEGPFLNPEKKGAHNPQHLLPPDPQLVSGWSRQNGVRLATLAPELPGALDVVRQLVDNGVVVSAGHSMASFAEAEAALQAGVRYGTHLFNAMPPLHHRHPGLVAALLADEEAVVGLIPDGLHVHPALVRLVWRLVGAQRLTLVTDAMAALGMTPGEYRLGDQTVRVDTQRATLPGGTLAGSILSLDGALRNLVAYTGCSIHEAIETVTSTPARLLGLDGHKGRVALGYDGDLVLLTPDLHVVATFGAGQLLFQRDHHE